MSCKTITAMSNALFKSQSIASSYILQCVLTIHSFALVLCCSAMVKFLANKPKCLSAPDRDAGVSLLQQVMTILHADLADACPSSCSSLPPLPCPPHRWTGTKFNVHMPCMLHTGIISLQCSECCLWGFVLSTSMTSFGLKGAAIRIYPTSPLHPHHQFKFPPPPPPPPPLHHGTQDLAEQGSPRTARATATPMPMTIPLLLPLLAVAGGGPAADPPYISNNVASLGTTRMGICHREVPQFTRAWAEAGTGAVPGALEVSTRAGFCSAGFCTPCAGYGFGGLRAL